MTILFDVSLPKIPARPQSRTVYLAGPISGLSYRHATEWRIEMTRLLEQYDILALDPMAGHESLLEIPALAAGGPITPDMEPTGITGRQIFLRDMDMIRDAGAVFANFPYINPGVGSCVELGAAWQMGKPVLIRCNPSLALHPFIENVGRVVPLEMELRHCATVIAEALIEVEYP